MFTYVCTGSIFTHYQQVAVLDTGVIRTDSTLIKVGECNRLTTTNLTDLLLVSRLRSEPRWLLDTYNLAVVNGLTYLMNITGSSLYIKGLQVLPEYIPHLQVDVIQVNTVHSRVSLSDLPPDTSPLTPTITFPYPGNTNTLILFLAGRYIHPDLISSDGTTLTVTLPIAMLDAIVNPAPGIVTPPIVTVADLFSHPASFFISTTGHTIDAVSMGQHNGIIYHAPPSKRLVAVAENGELPSYRPNNGTTVRFRYCQTLPTYWLKIS